MKTWIVSVSIVSVLASAALAQTPAPEAPSGVAPAPGVAPWGQANLVARPDPVVITGAEIPSFVGASLKSLGVFTRVQAHWVPIPYQFDERDPDGLLVFPYGPKSDRARATGRLKDRDELVFLAADGGDRWSPTAAPMPDGAVGGTEIGLHDPVDGTEAWAYLFQFSGDFPRSDRDYVSFDAAEARVTTDHMYFKYSPAQDKIYYDEIGVPRSGGGTGVNFIDRLKLRIHIKTRLWFSLSFDEDEWDSSVGRWIDGPVRVVREIQNELRFLGVAIAPTILVNAMYYRDFHVAPTLIHQTVNIPAIAKEAWFKFAIDLNENGKGMRYYRPSPGAKNPWHQIDGKMEPDEEALDPKLPDWHLVTGPQGTHLLRVEMPEPLVPVTNLYYVDDVTNEDDPEGTPGSIGEVGYKFDLFPLEQGVYNMRVFNIFPPNYKVGDEALYQRMIDTPLEIRLEAIPGAPSP
ncbi:MAG: hypothetical protein KC466_05135 [Myxococcales bacterium]|nr:hypothetical protein [Myxococcales bacterium]